MKTVVNKIAINCFADDVLLYNSISDKYSFRPTSFEIFNMKNHVRLIFGGAFLTTLNIERRIREMDED